MTYVFLSGIISIFGAIFYNIMTICQLAQFLQNRKFQESQLKGISAIFCNIFVNQEQGISLFLIKSNNKQKEWIRKQRLL